MGLLSRRQESKSPQPQLVVVKCDNEHVYMYFGPEKMDCYFCMLKDALDAGRLLNAQKLEITMLAKQHLQEWFTFLKENPNDIIERAAMRQATEIMAMVERHKREQEEVTKRLEGTR